MNRKISETVESLQRASRSMPMLWDGKKAILEMKEVGYRHWRQMEWPGFYFEFLCERTYERILEMPGKKYDNTTFDAFREISWDFKSHATNSSSRKIITNDSEAIHNTVMEHGYYGVILATGEAKYNDEDRTFKRWHDELKGEKSEYEIERIRRGAPSRRRKTRFMLSRIVFICLDMDLLNKYGGHFQDGFRNADGSPRRQKVLIDLSQLPGEAILAKERFM